MISIQSRDHRDGHVRSCASMLLVSRLAEPMMLIAQASGIFRSPAIAPPTKSF